MTDRAPVVIPRIEFDPEEGLENGVDGGAGSAFLWRRRAPFANNDDAVALFLGSLLEVRESAAQRSEVVRIRLYAAILAIDLLLVVAALWLVSLVHNVSDNSQSASAIIWLTVLVFIPTAVLTRSVNTENLKNSIKSMRSGAMTVIQTALFITAIAFCLKIGGELSRVVLIAGFSIALALVVLHRILMGSVYYRLYGGDSKHVLLIDDGAAAGALDHLMGVRLHLSSRGISFDSPVIMDSLASTLQLFDRVVVASDPARRAEWAFLLKSSSINGEIIDEMVARIGALGVSMEEGIGAWRVAVPSMGLRNRALKRATDLLIATSAVVFLSPLMLLIAFLIKMEDGGPILFKQTRIGRNNTLFQILKFRSMSVAKSDSNANQLTTRNDSRVTRIGNVIRRTSIDELPQLFNVIAGTMSIVGPRPHALGAKAGDVLYWEVDRGYWHRHRLKPGLTGLAQIRGHRGPTDTEADLQHRLYSDLEYIRNWSFWRDIGILLKTARVLVHKNAF